MIFFISWLDKKSNVEYNATYGAVYYELLLTGASLYPCFLDRLRQSTNLHWWVRFGCLSLPFQFSTFIDTELVWPSVSFGPSASSLHHEAMKRGVVCGRVRILPPRQRLPSTDELIQHNIVLAGTH